MKFCWSTITVKDMEESLDFYQGVAGLEIERRFSPREGMEIVFLGKGETKIELIRNGFEKEPTMGNGISLGFETESIDGLIKMLEEKGIEIAGGPFQPNQHIKYIFVLDPNGLRIQFVENM